MNDKQLANAFDDLWLKSAERNQVIGRLGDVNGTVAVPSRPNEVYVRKGDNGEQGQTTAIDRAGVAAVANQKVWMVWERKRLVIFRAEQYTGGSGGSSTLAGLSDVDLSGLADGDTLQYDNASSTWVPVVPTGGAGGAPSPHALSGVHHSGALAWADLSKTGSDLADLATKNHNDLDNIGANDHHNQSHTLVGSDHTASGLTIGHVVRASGASSFAWAQLQHNDLGGVTANQHHNQVHVITGSDHTVTGSALDVVGLSAANTLAVLTPSSNPGATAAILRTSSNGSLQLDTNLLYIDAPNNRIGVNQAPGNAALDVVAAANADHTQRLKQKSGQTGRLWRIENVAGDELIVLDSQGNLQSGMPGFVSGLTGWQITPTGTAEFNNVWVRGELHATVFVKDEIHATGGTMLVATAGKLYSDADIDSTTADGTPYEAQTTVVGYGTYHEAETTVVGYGQYHDTDAILNFIEIEDPPSGPGFYFQRYDVVRSKTEVATGVTDFWLEVKYGIQFDGYSRYSVIKRSGTDGVLPAGAAVVSYGVPGDGRILLTSDLNYAPYMDVFTVGPEVWTGAAGAIVPHVRLGRLDGVGVTATSGIEQYGLIAGTDLSNANSPYIVASNLQLRLHKVDLTLNDGTNDTGEWDASGNLTLGPNIGATATTTFSVQTTGSNAGDVIIGDHALSGNYLRWDQSAGSLVINGTLQVGGANVATTGYVDTAEADAIAAAASDATTKANAAESDANNYTDGRETDIRADLTFDIAQGLTDAQEYANERRVVGVAGTWTSTDANTISWSGVTVRFGDARTVTINNGNTGNMAARTYIYMTATATGTVSFSTTTSIGGLTTSHALIAVADLGTDFASVSVVAGSTYISGDNIITGSVTATQVKAASITGDRLVANTITATQIAASTITATEIASNAITSAKISAGAVTANKISVDGNIDISTTGAIRGNAKAYGSATSGFFVGYNAGAYKVDIGDSTNFLRWDGSALRVRTNDTVVISNNSTGRILSMNGTGVAHTLDLIGNVLSTTANFHSDQITCEKIILNDDTLQIATPRTPASYTAAGFEGEICWDIDYLYVCIADGLWTRIALSTGAW